MVGSVRIFYFDNPTVRCGVVRCDLLGKRQNHTVRFGKTAHRTAPHKKIIKYFA